MTFPDVDIAIGPGFGASRGAEEAQVSHSMTSGDSKYLIALALQNLVDFHSSTPWASYVLPGKVASHLSSGFIDLFCADAHAKIFPQPIQGAPQLLSCLGPLKWFFQIRHDCLD
jgi:hypothetical protein